VRLDARTNKQLAFHITIFGIMAHWQWNVRVGPKADEFMQEKC